MRSKVVPSHTTVHNVYNPSRLAMSASLKPPQSCRMYIRNAGGDNASELCLNPRLAKARDRRFSGHNPRTLFDGNLFSSRAQSVRALSLISAFLKSCATFLSAAAPLSHACQPLPTRFCESVYRGWQIASGDMEEEGRTHLDRWVGQSYAGSRSNKPPVCYIMSRPAMPQVRRHGHNPGSGGHRRAVWHGQQEKRQEWQRFQCKPASHPD